VHLGKLDSVHVRWAKYFARIYQYLSPCFFAHVATFQILKIACILHNTHQSVVQYHWSGKCTPAAIPSAAWRRVPSEDSATLCRAALSTRVLANRRIIMPWSVFSCIPSELKCVQRTMQVGCWAFTHVYFHQCQANRVQFPQCNVMHVSRHGDLAGECHRMLVRTRSAACAGNGQYVCSSHLRRSVDTRRSPFSNCAGRDTAHKTLRLSLKKQTREGAW